MGMGRELIHQIVPIHAFGPATPSSASPDWLSLKNVDSLDVVIVALNGTTVTGSAVALAQSQDVAGTNSKALAFTRYFTMTDPANSNNYTLTNASSNTFTTITTNNATQVAVIPIDPQSLDGANGFDCVRVTLGNATAATLAAFYRVKPKYGGNETARPSVIVD